MDVIKLGSTTLNVPTDTYKYISTWLKENEIYIEMVNLDKDSVSHTANFEKAFVRLLSTKANYSIEIPIIDKTFTAQSHAVLSIPEKIAKIIYEHECNKKEISSSSDMVSEAPVQNDNLTVSP